MRTFGRAHILAEPPVVQQLPVTDMRSDARRSQGKRCSVVAESGKPAMDIPSHLFWCRRLMPQDMQSKRRFRRPSLGEAIILSCKQSSQAANGLGIAKVRKRFNRRSTPGYRHFSIKSDVAHLPDIANRNGRADTITVAVAGTPG